MRAVLVRDFGPTDGVEIGEIEAPMKLGTEVIVDVHAAGMNPIDFKTVTGKGAAKAVEPLLPWVPGGDVAGIVAAAPYEAHDLQPGDAVYGIANHWRTRGSFAEQVAVPSLALAPKPESLSFEEAAAVPCAALTAWDAVVRVAKARAGQRILIHAGAGGVGHFAVQFAKYFGAQVATTVSERNVDFVRSLGADEVVDYGKDRFEDVLQKVDVVVDLIGNVADDTGTRSLDVLKHGGLYLNVPTGSWPDYASVAAERGLRASAIKVESDGSNLGIIARLIDAGDVRVEVQKVYQLGQVHDAFATLQGGHVRGKLVLKVR
ncbi:NADP-dependent oxidoreductase [Agrococcus sp. ARC_14]|uniref:NADP-dependent oxidoreductase n=1 Tax=Agrococcus sp. ARC_14 TaxID=2919927 RepID=UPI001F057C98|nr:NADP-dependent oxidoreductase [Agrococcus sp. ARC_14]MCH1882179.1 NADP-dependent oxidoreductase [Agrococcus sp. ARC_14]